MTVKRVELPIFHLGTYTSSNGQPVTFTPELLRQMERNTKLVIRTSKFQPPVGYDHPAARDTNAHGFITDVRYDNGKLIAVLDGVSEKLRTDAKEFRRLTYSPEFHEDFSFVHDGKAVKVGPTVIGLAMLGAQRGAIKNTAMVPLSEVAFGEAVSEVEALVLREDLRAMGYVGEYVVEGKHFGEVENDASRFFEEQEPQMTDAEIQAAIAAGIKSAITGALDPLKTQIETQGAQIRQFGEEAKTRSKAEELAKTVGDEKKWGNITRTRFVEALVSPTMDTVRAFGESVSAVVLPGGKEKKAGESAGDEAKEEPPALAKLRIRHFSEMTGENESLVLAGIEALPQVVPDAFKGVENNQDAQIARTLSYVRQRDLGTN